MPLAGPLPRVFGRLSREEQKRVPRRCNLGICIEGLVMIQNSKILAAAGALCLRLTAPALRRNRWHRGRRSAASGLLFRQYGRLGLSEHLAG